MNKKFIPALSELTDVMQTMDLVSIKHGVSYYYWIVKQFDIDKQDEIHNICKKHGLEWEVKPQPNKVTNGKSPSTGNKLNDIRYKRKPLTKGVLPLEVARAKIIVRKKRKVKRG